MYWVCIDAVGEAEGRQCWAALADKVVVEIKGSSSHFSLGFLLGFLVNSLLTMDMDGRWGFRRFRYGHIFIHLFESNDLEGYCNMFLPRCTAWLFNFIVNFIPSIIDD